MRRGQAIGLATAMAGIVAGPAAAWTPPVVLAHPGTGSTPVVALRGTGSAPHGGFAWRAGSRVFAAALTRTRVRMGPVSTIGAPYDFAFTGAGGALLVAVPAVRRLDLLRSTDGGRWTRRRSALTFTPVDPLLAPVWNGRAVLSVGGDPQLFVSAVAPSGTVASWTPVLGARSWSALGGQLYGNGMIAASASPAGVVAAVSSDSRGFGVQEQALALDAGDGVVNGIAAAVRSTGEAVLLVTLRDSGASGQIVALRRSPGGSWSDPDWVSQAGRPVLSGPPSVTARLSGGNLVAAWREGARGGIQVVAAVEVLSHQGQWRAPRYLSVPARTVGRPVLATAPDGRVILVYTVNGRVLSRQLGRQTASYRWSAPTLVSHAGSVCSSPAIAFQPDGRAAVAFICGASAYLTTE